MRIFLIRSYKCCIIRVDINEGIDLTKTNKNKEWMVCYYWPFNHGVQVKD